MNDNTQVSTEVSERRARRSRRIIIGTLSILVLIAAAGVLISKTGLDRALVRQQLDAIAAQMKTRGAAQGRDVKFTYGDVEIAGSFSNKHAVIHSPVLAVKPLDAPGYEKPTGDAPKTLRVTSETMEIYPEGANLSAMRIEMPKPIDITTIEAPEKKLLTVTTDTPLTVHYANTKRDNAPITRWQFTAPAETQFTYLREQVAEGAEEQTPTLSPVYETLVMNMDKGEGELSMQRDHSGLGEGTLDLKNIRIAPQSAPKEGLVTINQIVSQWSNQRNEQNLNVVNSSFRIDQISADANLLPYAPISAAMEVVYEGAIPTTQEELASIEAKESAFKLKTFSITTKDATFAATADFVANPEDRLPVGMANVTVTNLPFIVGELKKYKLLSDDREAIIATLLQQVTGTPYGQMKDVVVDVQRSRGGSFKIGQSTFEELFATLLQASLGKGAGPKAVIDPSVAAPAVPVIPDAQNRKAQEPIEIPQETRG